MARLKDDVGESVTSHCMVLAGPSFPESARCRQRRQQVKEVYRSSKESPGERCLLKQSRFSKPVHM